MSATTENKNETFQPVTFQDVREGDRVQFVTANNGFGSDGGDLWRTGTVTKVTTKTVTVEITGPNPLAEDVFRDGKSRKLGRTARLRQADWHHRCVSKAAIEQEKRVADTRYFAQIETRKTGRTGVYENDMTNWFAIYEVGVADAIEFHKLPYKANRDKVKTLRELGWELDGDLDYIAGINAERAPVQRIEQAEAPQFCGACGDVFATTAALDSHQAETGHEMDQPDHPLRKRPDLRQLANPKKADPETVAEIHASRCPECRGAGCPQCGYKGVPRTICPQHHVVDKRGGRAIELGTIPACEPGVTYGAWSEGAGGFVYSGVDCATDAANWAADELRQLAKDDDADTIQILAICREHEEQPANGCEDCNAEDEG